MKSLKSTIGALIIGATLAWGFASYAADAGKPADQKKAKPYTLQTCIVSDEKLDGDMGKPYVFVHQGQEYKLCCKSCLKDFNKEPAKYAKKLAAAEKAQKEKGQNQTPAKEHKAHNEHQH